jgi:hypothetical protein
MPKVWTPSHGTIHNPSPSGRLVCFNSPVRRFWLVSAAMAFAASSVPRVRLRIRSASYLSFNTVAAREVARLTKLRPFERV